MVETSALATARVARLSDRRLVAALDDLDFSCGIELSYHSDLRIVQRNLNDIPHPDREPRVPAAAVRQLAALAAGHAGASVH